jgi:hypothetical protein
MSELEVFNPAVAPERRNDMKAHLRAFEAWTRD